MPNKSLFCESPCHELQRFDRCPFRIPKPDALAPGSDALGGRRGVAETETGASQSRDSVKWRRSAFGIPFKYLFEDRYEKLPNPKAETTRTGKPKCACLYLRCPVLGCSPGHQKEISSEGTKRKTPFWADKSNSMLLMVNNMLGQRPWFALRFNAYLLLGCRNYKQWGLTQHCYLGGD